ncbi:DUF6470 family protein [Paenibacillus chibensis]|uniref:DUF6470 family protein n=1 Tax=Paenibacillus chibensis TaxID=59846 RepID=UPI000FDB81D3|nr:DUF6470 family protein [Paenibacillus chibensis]MEC0370807.1 DUF6470 family protein [Paenibacillus chibensis]
MVGITPASSGPLYVPAELTIRTQAADLQTDMTEVYEDLGLKRPSTFRQEDTAETRQILLENIALKAQEGDRMLNPKARKGNVFGDVAHQRYMRTGPKEVTIEALPRHGVYIDFRIHPPEIHIEAKGALPS